MEPTNTPTDTSTDTAGTVVTPTASDDAYANYAPYFDVITGDRGARALRIQGYIRRYAPSAQTVLELACGTGGVLAKLDATFKLTGLDSSQAMLRIAQGKLPNAEFFHGDMTSFNLSRQFDAVYCTFNSIDQLLKWESWQQLFACVAYHLKSGGVFVFDTNTEERLKRLIRLSPYPRELPTGDTVIIRAENSPDDKDVMIWKVNVIRNSDADVKSVTIANRTFPPEQITSELQRYFDVVQTETGEGDPVLTEDGGRTYYVCVKKDGSGSGGVTAASAAPRITHEEDAQGLSGTLQIH